MKRFLQIVAVAVVAILAAQPALAGMTCGMLRVPIGPCAPACGMAMSQMGADCQMAKHVAGSGCMQECCRNGFPQGVLQSSTPAKPKAAGTQIVTAFPQLAPHVQAASAAAPTISAIVAAAPPRHILISVFRI
jgi:hypothetical protein